MLGFAVGLSLQWLAPPAGESAEPPPVQRPARLSEESIAPPPVTAEGEAPAPPTTEDGATEDVPGDPAAAPAPEANEPDSTPCPCPIEDWQCMQAHETECADVGPRSASQIQTDVETAPRPESRTASLASTEPVRTGPMRPVRHGVLVGAGLGVLGCARGWCDTYGYKAGGLGRFEVGYRHGIIAGVVSFAGGGAKVDRATALGLGPGKVTLFDLDVGVLLFPVRTHRIDPYFGLGLGWSRVRAHDFAYGGGSVGERVSRGALRVTGGLSGYLTRMVSLGLRFDLHTAFGGRLCLEADYPVRIEGPECADIRDLEETIGVDSSELPLPWAVSVDLRFVIPVGPPRG